MMFDLQYDRLSTKEKEEFATVVNLLFSKNYLLRDFYSEKEKTTRTDSAYRFVERHQELIELYLSYSGWELNVDTKYGVTWVINRLDRNKETLNKATTVILLVLRLIYDEEREKLSLKREILTSVSDIVNKLLSIGTYKKKPADSELSDAFRKLEGYNVLSKLGGKWTEPETKILIYPSILFILTDARIKDLYELMVDPVEDDDETV
jgi:hypothetical protein